MFDAPKFRLTDQTGTEFGSQELAGQVWVVDFIFTNCMATCPQQTQQFFALQEHTRRWPDFDRVHLVSFTVDPKRDTVERLHEYADSHKANYAHWKFLTGAREELVRISKDGFKLPVSDAQKDSTPITHSSRFVLVDSKGRIRGYYDGLSKDEYGKLLLDLRTVLSEPGQGTNGVVHLGVPAEVFDSPWMKKRAADQLAKKDEISVFHDFQFTDSLDASGIRFLNRAVTDATRDFKKSHYDHATGIAVADVDNDGQHDIYFVNQVGGNQLWRNLGEGRFEDITESAGVGLEGRVCVTASFSDTDNDGDTDLYVTTTRHGNAFFENDGGGHFRDVTEKSGLTYSGHSSSADFFDYDRDGKLDLFLTNVGVFTTDEIGYSADQNNRKFPYYLGREDAFAGHLFPERSERSILYHNEGENRFRDVSEEVGLVHEGWSGDATPLDLNDDGWMDLYVVNMQGNDQCYLNIQGKKFVAQGKELFPKSVWGGMSVKSFDFNNDGSMDLFITNMHADMWENKNKVDEEKRRPPDDIAPESFLHSRIPGSNILGNALFMRGKEGPYHDVATGVNAENYWPWGLSVGDLNADGLQDVFIASCMNYPFRYHVNSLLLNDQGKEFRDAEFILGIEPRHGGRTAVPWFELDCSGRDKDHELAALRRGRVQVWAAIGTRSAAIFDLDQDGDLDIVTNDFHTPPMVLVSDLDKRQKDMSYLKIELRGTKSNRDGLGAKVQLEAGGKTLTQVHDGQSGYLSQSSLPLYFGLGNARHVDKITISWPSGETQVLSGPIKSNQQLVIEEATDSK